MLDRRKFLAGCAAALLAPFATLLPRRTLAEIVEVSHDGVWRSDGTVEPPVRVDGIFLPEGWLKIQPVNHNIAKIELETSCFMLSPNDVIEMNYANGTSEFARVIAVQWDSIEVIRGWSAPRDTQTAVAA